MDNKKVKQKNRIRSPLRQRLCIGMSLAATIFCYSCGSVAYAAEEETIRSRGSLIYQEKGMAEIEEEEMVVYDATDIRKIKEYLDLQKEGLLQKLLQLGTAFIQTDTGWQYSRNPEDMPGSIPEGGQIGWDLLFNAVRDSQSVPENIAVKDSKFPLQIEGIAEHTDSYRAATADNISKGKAAWLEGTLLLGTGADNDKAYEKGKEDGTGGIFRPEIFPIYAADEKEIIIQHKHIGNTAETEGVSGCYHNYTSKELKESICGAALQQTESTWYPNEAEAGGGSWHGGYYTCPWHGGVYDNPGTCTRLDSQETTVWHHDIVCGKTNLVYALLKITDADDDFVAGKMQLRAELVEQEGFSELLLPEAESDWLVWSNEKGEIVGKGDLLEIQSAGTYFCKLAAENQDVELLGGSVQVVIQGFTY